MTRSLSGVLLVFASFLAISQTASAQGKTFIERDPCTGQLFPLASFQGAQKMWIIKEGDHYIFESSQLGAAPFNGATITDRGNLNPIFGCDPTHLYLQVTRVDNGRVVFYGTPFNSGVWTVLFESAGTDERLYPAPPFSSEITGPHMKGGTPVSFVKATHVVSQGSRVVMLADGEGVNGISSRIYELTVAGPKQLHNFGSDGIWAGSFDQACITGKSLLATLKLGSGVTELVKVDGGGVDGGGNVTIKVYTSNITLTCSSSQATVTPQGQIPELFPD